LIYDLKLDLEKVKLNHRVKYCCEDTFLSKFIVCYRDGHIVTHANGPSTNTKAVDHFWLHFIAASGVTSKKLDALYICAVLRPMEALTDPRETSTTCVDRRNAFVQPR